MFVVAYGGSTLYSYKYSKLRIANEDVSKIVNKRQFLLDTHNELAAKYDKEVEWTEVSHKFIKQRWTLLSYAEGKVLETGVGTGLNLPYYKATRVKELVGVDWSIKMIEEALAKEDSEKMSFKLADVEKLPFPDAYFDTVVDTFSI